VRRVLLLNVTYEPLTTVGLRRAVCLVLGGKAEIVHDDVEGAVLHAASVALATPSVIRLRRGPGSSMPRTPSASRSLPALIRLINGFAQVKIDWNTTNIRARKINVPQILWVSIWSSRSELRSLRANTGTPRLT